MFTLNARNLHQLTRFSYQKNLRNVTSPWKLNHIPSKTFKTQFRFQSSRQLRSDDKKTNSFHDILRLLKLAKPESKLITIGLICMVATSAGSMVMPSIIGKVIDTSSESKDSEAQISILGKKFSELEFYTGVGAVFVITGITNYGRIYLLKKVAERVVYKLRSTIVKNLFFQSSKFWDINKSGDLISRLVNDTTIISKSVTHNLNDGLRGTIQGVVGVTMMLFISVQLTGYMVLMFPPIIIVSLIFGRAVRALSKQTQEQLGSLTKISEEQFSFVKTMQSFARENFELTKYTHLLDDLYKLGIKEARLQGTYYSSTGFLGNSLLVALLIIGTNMVRSNQLSIGDLSSFMMYAVYSGSSFFTLSNFYAELMKGVGASSRVFEMLYLTPEIKSDVGLKVLKQKEFNKLQDRTGYASIDGDIEFRNIKFNYPTRENHQIFGGLDLKIKKGDHVCLVGPSGCGKSSIVQLLFRHYDVQAGDILINGYDLTKLNLQTLRSNIGIVQQEPMLFSGSIRENLSYGKLDATEEELINVCKLANCYDFIMSFPDKFDTIIGAKGTQLSGGQKQRIALARMLLTDPEIIVLDEATSALDNNSELAINDTLRLLRNRTIISVAHRLSTIKMSDKIVVLGKKQGEAFNDVVEIGTYNQLINNKDSELVKLLERSLDGEDTEVELSVADNKAQN